MSIDKKLLDLADLELHLGYWLRRVSNRVSGTFVQALQKEQISGAEWVALCIVRQNEKTTPSQIAAAMGMTRGAVSKVLDKLEAKKWISRATEREDGRVQWIVLTRSGARLLPKLVEIADHNDEHFFSCLDRNEQAVLKRLLVKLTEVHRLRGTPVD